MNRMKPLAAVVVSGAAILALGGCSRHTTIIEPQPQSQPRPDHDDYHPQPERHDDYHPQPPDRHDDRHDDHR